MPEELSGIFQEDRVQGKVGNVLQHKGEAESVKTFDDKQAVFGRAQSNCVLTALFIRCSHASCYS